MSKTLEIFKSAALATNWPTAIMYSNGLNMYEMLRGLDSLPRNFLNNLQAQLGNFVNRYNTERINYAIEVVKNYKLPARAPGDLEATGQVQDAKVFLASTRGGSKNGKKYTDSPNEFVTTRTTPSVAAVVMMLQAAWPELTNNGARTLTAQFMAETGGGKYCFNWNLGNVKAGANEPHMYLANVWECDSQDGANAQIARSGGLARIATSDEIRVHGWKCPRVVVVFSPPHPQCRFRAYASLADGAQRWLGHHRRIASRNPNFLAALNVGDVAAVAHALKMARYYTAAEVDYARAMRRAKADVDRQLGPLP
jgi:hypothetical protein